MECVCVECVCVECVCVECVCVWSVCGEESGVSVGVVDTDVISRQVKGAQTRHDATEAIVGVADGMKL